MKTAFIAVTSCDNLMHGYIIIIRECNMTCWCCESPPPEEDLREEKARVSIRTPTPD